MINLRNQKVDLSHINSLEDIDQEIRNLKRRIREREHELGEDFKKIPKEAVKASLGSFIPLFKKDTPAQKAFGTAQTIVSGLIAAFVAGKKGGGFKKGLAAVLSQLSFAGTARAVASYFANRKSKAGKTAKKQNGTSTTKGSEKIKTDMPADANKQTVVTVETDATP